MEEKDQETSKNKDNNQQSARKWLKLIVILVWLIVVGVLIWLLVVCRQHKNDLEAENQTLRSKVKDLEAKVAVDDDAEDADDAAACSPTVTDAFKNTIADAVTSRNYAALEGSMADQVTVVYAATEFGGQKTPAEAVSAMDYLNNGTAPWDFDLPEATINGYRAGFYEQYFPANAYVGKSSDDLVVSFGFDDCAKINMIFIAANAETL